MKIKLQRCRFQLHINIFKNTLAICVLSELLLKNSQIKCGHLFLFYCHYMSLVIKFYEFYILNKINSIHSFSGNLFQFSSVFASCVPTSRLSFPNSILLPLWANFLTLHLTLNSPAHSTLMVLRRISKSLTSAS